MSTAAQSFEQEQVTAFGILTTLSFCHLLNDVLASLVPSLYPVLKASFGLSFAQIGLLTMSHQVTASLLQPLIGVYTDRRPRPYSLAIGMIFMLVGMILLAAGWNFRLLIVAAALVGLGSAVFHPESSRIARLASGGHHGFAQSFFQLGGNVGSSLGPLIVAYFVLPHGRLSIAWFSVVALAGIGFLWHVGTWYRSHLIATSRSGATASAVSPVSSREVKRVVAILLALIFSKYVYLASFSSYYAFYLISRFQLSVRAAQVHLFLFFAAVAVGTILGGPIGDRIGRRVVIIASILGVLPFTLVLPHVNLFWTRILSVVIGVVLASAFSAIVVYAQELMPGRVGMVAGLFFGVAFGTAGLGAAALGRIADRTSIFFVYQLCAFLPVIGVLALRLPRLDRANSA
jgi:MFS transporter, FSR family, fosmidomycin resistance protein